MKVCLNMGSRRLRFAADAHLEIHPGAAAAITSIAVRNANGDAVSFPPFAAFAALARVVAIHQSVSRPPTCPTPE
jgi:hypothetical protein